MKFEDRNHTGRPPTNDDFFRVVPWKSTMGFAHPSEWLLEAIKDEAKITVEDNFVFEMTTPSSGNSKKRAK